MYTLIRSYFLEYDLQSALEKHAEAIGDREKHMALHLHFKAKADNIDPKKDHWGYAEMRDKELEHRASAEAKDAEVTQWVTKIVDLENKLKPIPKPPCKRPWMYTFRKKVMAT